MAPGAFDLGLDSRVAARPGYPGWDRSRAAQLHDRDYSEAGRSTAKQHLVARVWLTRCEDRWRWFGVSAGLLFGGLGRDPFTRWLRALQGICPPGITGPARPERLA